MRRIRAVGFDLDGTLFDHHGSATAAATGFLASLAIVPTEGALAAWFEAEHEFFERWRLGQLSVHDQRRERLRSVLPQFGAEVPTEACDLDALFDRYLVGYRAAWRAYADSASLLRQLRALGFRVGLLTNGTEAQQLDKLGRTSLLAAFDAVCISEQIGAQKPAAAAFQRLAAELRVDVDECLFVGDNPEHDVAGATAAGMPALLIDRGPAGENAIADAVFGALGIARPAVAADPTA